jgi:hypothetical protein
LIGSVGFGYATAIQVFAVRHTTLKIRIAKKISLNGGGTVVVVEAVVSLTSHHPLAGSELSITLDLMNFNRPVWLPFHDSGRSGVRKHGFDEAHRGGEGQLAF